MGNFLKNLVEKFKINTEIKATNTKYLSVDEKLILLNKFFEETVKPVTTFYKSTQSERLFEFIFKTKEDAIKFSKNPSHGLLPFVRKQLLLEGKDPKTIDQFFNIIVIYDESKENKKPNLVLIRLGQ